jgi:hypothetical protein
LILKNKKRCKEAIDKGISPYKIIDAMSKGMDMLEKYKVMELLLSFFIS